jgi:hypothetical protein
MDSNSSTPAHILNSPYLSMAPIAGVDACKRGIAPGQLRNVVVEPDACIGKGGVQLPETRRDHVLDSKPLLDYNST